MPIYLITVQGSSNPSRIVDAPTKAGAINHVIRDTVSAAVLTASEVVTHMQAGVPVEKAAPSTKTEEGKPTNDK